MDTRTGEMISFEDLKKKPMQEQKHFVEIPESMMHEIDGMNRHQRRAWVKLNRKRIAVELAR